MGVGVGREHSPVFCVCYPSLQTLALFHDQTENSNFKLKWRNQCTISDKSWGKLKENFYGLQIVDCEKYALLPPNQANQNNIHGSSHPIDPNFFCAKSSNCRPSTKTISVVLVILPTLIFSAKSPNHRPYNILLLLLPYFENNSPFFHQDFFLKFNISAV